MKTTKLTASTFVIALLLPVLFSGCGTTEVAKGQQAVHVSAINFQKFLEFEKANRDTLWALNQGIKHTADKLRHRECAQCDPNGVRWLTTAVSLVDAYKNNRTPENKANMETALAVIQQLVEEITNYFIDPQVAALSPSTAASYHKGTKVVP